ncbi:hypothetical protein QJS10_CPB14g01273 [Acorus calamus]|uniref:Uncharacterized protein n=1 Tax=Acorus calamus TaxID=4465 RepID=A0AAV9DAL2_ACOCL|nr:hypothetical protein QJS10_CPB14g01273 [Acorus calamus]
MAMKENGTHWSGKMSLLSLLLLNSTTHDDRFEDRVVVFVDLKTVSEIEFWSSSFIV